MNIEHIKNRDCFIPNIAISPTDQRQIGRYGLMRLHYLKEYRPIVYNQLILSSKLYAHLGEIDQTCQDRMECMIPQMKEVEGVTEALKAANQMEWVRRMNNIHLRAEETILSELIFG